MSFVSLTWSEVAFVKLHVLDLLQWFSSLFIPDDFRFTATSFIYPLYVVVGLCL